MAREAVEITIILDQSGSMGSIWDDTIGGFNALIEDQRRVEADDPVRVTLVAFNHHIHPIFTRVPLAEVPPLTRKTYKPGGSTALLDAVGETIHTLEARLRVEPIKQAIVVILTDGQENASRGWAKRREEIAEMISRLEKEGAEFIFLGANIDAFEEGGSLGISRHSSYIFKSNAEGISGAYGAMSARMTLSRTGDFTGMAGELNRAIKQAMNEPIDDPVGESSSPQALIPPKPLRREFQLRHIEVESNGNLSKPSSSEIIDDKKIKISSDSEGDKDESIDQSFGTMWSRPGGVAKRLNAFIYKFLNKKNSMNTDD